MPETLHPLGSKKKERRAYHNDLFQKLSGIQRGDQEESPRRYVSGRSSEGTSNRRRSSPRSVALANMKVSSRPHFHMNGRTQMRVSGDECNWEYTAPGATAEYNYRGGKAVRTQHRGCKANSDNVALQLPHYWHRWGRECRIPS